jgi:hypothetical protein
VHHEPTVYHPNSFPEDLAAVFNEQFTYNSTFDEFIVHVDVRNKVEWMNAHSFGNHVSFGVFDRFENEVLHYLHGDHCEGVNSYSAAVELQCWDSVSLEQSDVENTCHKRFVLKAPVICNISLPISQASVIADEKVLRAARLLVAKYEEVGKSVTDLLKNAAEYENCLKFAAGKLAKTNSKMCIDFIGRRSHAPADSSLASNDHRIEN